MNVFDFPTPGAAAEELVAEQRRVREYLRAAVDPNETGENGRTLLTLALMTSFEGQGEDLVWDLIRRGADPNRPSGWVNFTLLLTVSNSLSLVQEFVRRGLRLNEVYEGVEERTGGLLTGPSTLLDYTYAVRGQITARRKRTNRLADDYAGGLGKRRQFIDNTIALLEAAGAQRASDLSAGPGKSPSI